MALDPRRLGKRHDETEEVIQHFSRTLDRVLDFLGYSIHDVINDPIRREHVRRAFLLSRRIDRDIESEPWRGQATEGLAEAIRRRVGLGGDIEE
jgi:hypothetical protein